MKAASATWTPELVEADSSLRGLSSREFERIRSLVYEKAGIDLRPGKEQLVSSRLRKLIIGRGLHTFDDYYRYVVSDRTGDALVAMVDALTTNYTTFLREPAHFEYLCDDIARQLASRPRIEIWSAACATGEEPYSIAFSLFEALGPAALDKVRILATDISTKALASAERAIYHEDRFDGLSRDWMRKYFLRGEYRWQGSYRVKPQFRSMVEFGRLNLIEPLASRRTFAAVFCRNVMIYFDKPTQEGVVTRLYEALEPGGYLFIGHAESLTGVPHRLQYVRPAVYRKAGRDDKPAAARHRS